MTGARVDSTDAVSAHAEDPHATPGASLPPPSVVVAFVLLLLLAVSVRFLLAARTKRLRLERDFAQRAAAAEHTRALAVLRSEAKYRALAVHAPVGIFEADAQGDCIFVNEKWQELTGLAFEQAVGKGWLRVMHPDDADRVARAWYEAAVTGVPFSIDYRYQSTRGEVVWVQGSSAPLRDAHGVLTGYLGTIVDVTDRRRALDALATSEANFRLLVEHAPFGVVVFRDTTILYLNKSCLRMLGYDDLSALYGRSLLDTVVHPRARELVRGHIEDADRGAPLPSMQLPCIRRDGSEILIESASSRLLFDGSPAVAGVVRDVTEQHRAEAIRLGAEQALRESLHEKEMLLKEVHHRVKNNLQVIVSLINLQASKLEEPHARSTFEETRSRVHAIALLHERLYRSKNLGHIDMRDYLEGLASDLSSTNLDQRPITLTVRAEDVYFEMDTAVPVGLIVNELVTNAYKHAFPHDGRAGGAIQVELRCQEGDVVISVADDGAGLPADFDPDNLDSLGLLLISSLSRQLDGELSFETSPHGARGSVRFPAPVAEAQQSAERRAAAP